jgi:hypothetical protein
MKQSVFEELCREEVRTNVMIEKGKSDQASQEKVLYLVQKVDIKVVERHF